MAAYRYSVPVRFNDCDGMKHVNNAVYLSYVEEARINFFLTLRTPGEKAFASRALVQARSEIDYIFPARYGAPVDIDVSVLEVGTSSVRMGFELTQSGVLVARAQSVTVGYDIETGKSRPFTDFERVPLEKAMAAASAPA